MDKKLRYFKKIQLPIIVYVEYICVWLSINKNKYETPKCMYAYNISSTALNWIILCLCVRCC